MDFYSGFTFTLRFALWCFDYSFGSDLCAKCTPIDCLNHNLWDVRIYPGLQSNNNPISYCLGNAFEMEIFASSHCSVALRQIPSTTHFVTLFILNNLGKHKPHFVATTWNAVCFFSLPAFSTAYIDYSQTAVLHWFFFLRCWVYDQINQRKILTVFHFFISGCILLAGNLHSLLISNNFTAFRHLNRMINEYIKHGAAYLSPLYTQNQTKAIRWFCNAERFLSHFQMHFLLPRL